MNKLIKFVLCLSLVLLITGCKMESDKIEVHPIDKSLAVQKIAKEVKEGIIDVQDINENVIENHLMTADYPTIDLI